MGQSLVLAVATGGAAVLLIASAGALASRRIGFPYPYLTILSFLVYGAAGILGARNGSIGAAALAGALVGLIDSTVGWRISWLIGPGAPPPDKRSASAIASAIVSVVAMATAVGLAAAYIARAAA